MKSSEWSAREAVAAYKQKREAITKQLIESAEPTKEANVVPRYQTKMEFEPMCGPAR